MFRVRRRFLRQMRREVGRTLAVFVGFAFLVGVLRGGSRYLYCPFMDAIVSQSCCERAPHHEVAVDEPDCCEAHVLGVLPSAMGPSAPSRLPPPNVIALIAGPGRDFLQNLVATTRRRIEPTRRPPPESARRPAQLMVFLI